MLVLALAVGICPAAFAEDISTMQAKSPERVVSATTMMPGATVDFVDSTLVNGGGIQPYGEVNEVYDHSYYVFDHGAISKYDVGPREKDKFIISVARGATASLKTKVEVNATIQFGASVSIDIKEVIAGGFKMDLSAGFTYEWEVGRTFSGPDTNSQYDSCSYYGAVNYDQYSCYIKRYDVYKRYNGNAYLQDVTYYRGVSTINNVKVPKAVEYSVFSNQAR